MPKLPRAGRLADPVDTNDTRLIGIDLDLEKYPNLRAYARDFYTVPAFRDTTEAGVAP